MEKFNPDEEVDEESEFTTTETMGFFELIGREMSYGDAILFWTGIMSAVIFGSAMPGFSLFFGEMIDDLGT